MKTIAIAIGSVAAFVAAAAFAQPYDWRDRPVSSGAKYECYNPRAGVFERVRPGERQDDLDLSRCHGVGGDWRYNRGSDSGPYECWNPRARTYERVRDGEVQDDLDFGRCRGTSPENYSNRRNR